MSFARPRLRLARAASLAAGAATAALAAGVITVPAQAVQQLHVSFIDAAANQQLTTGLTDASGLAAVAAGQRTSYYDMSADGAVVAVNGQTGAASTPTSDVSGGLLVASGGSTHLVATYVDANPVVKADGSVVWFAAGNNIYSYSVGGAAAAVTATNPLVPPTGEYLSRISVSPDGTRVAAVFRTQGAAQTTSKIVVFTNDSTAATLWSQEFSGASSPEALNEVPQWTDAATTLVYGTCTTGACTAWTYAQVDVSAPTNTTTPVTGLDNLYSLRQLNGVWYGYKDSGTGASQTTAEYSAVALAGLDTTMPTSRPNSQNSFVYVPTTGVPATVSATTSLDRTPTAAHLDLSTGTVKTGGHAVYDAYAFYLKALGGQSFADWAVEVDRGALQYSVDRGAHWTRLRFTSGATTVPWPGGGPAGNGATQALTRNTWFRWSYAGDAYSAAATSAVSLVKVIPTVAAKVTKSGTKRIVAGSARRIGGTAILYKGTKKIATVRISAKGVFSFGKRVLAKGTYVVRTPADVSWAAGAVTLKVA